jgi:hypothetical protein
MADGRDSFIAKHRIAEKPETAADKLKTHGLHGIELVNAFQCSELGSIPSER